MKQKPFGRFLNYSKTSLIISRLVLFSVCLTYILPCAERILFPVLTSYIYFRFCSVFACLPKGSTFFQVGAVFNCFIPGWSYFCGYGFGIDASYSLDLFLMNGIYLYFLLFWVFKECRYSTLAFVLH